MVLNTYRTEKVPSSQIQIVGDSARPYERIIDYFRSIGEIVSSPFSADSRDEMYVFDLLPTLGEQIIVVRMFRNEIGTNSVVDVRVMGENASAIIKNLETLVRLDKDGEQLQKQRIELTNR